MGVFSAFRREQAQESAATLDSTTDAQPADRPERPVRPTPSAAPARRDITLEDGLVQLMQSVDGLIDLEQRLTELESDMIGQSPVALGDLPTTSELGLDGVVPRLMETAVLIGALSRRMHLRVGVLEGALGVRAKPVSPEVLEDNAPQRPFGSNAADVLSELRATPLLEEIRAVEAEIADEHEVERPITSATDGGRAGADAAQDRATDAEFEDHRETRAFQALRESHAARRESLTGEGRAEATNGAAEDTLDNPAKAVIAALADVRKTLEARRTAYRTEEDRSA